MRNITFNHPPETRKRTVATISLILMLLLVLGLAVKRTKAAILENPVQSYASAALAENVFGVEITPLNDSGGLSEIMTTQTKWVKGVEILWSEVEPTPGNYEWSILQDSVAEFNNAIQANLTPIVVIRNAPEFARLVSGLECGPIDPDFYTYFGDFVIELTANSESPFYGKALPYISIWNEPDIDPDYPDTFSESFGGCWGDVDDPYYGGEAYGDMLDVIYHIVKAAHPATQIIAGELLLDCSPDLDSDCLPGKFFEGVLQSTSSFDGVSFHGYDFYMGSIGQYGNTNWDSGWNSSGPVLVSKAEYIAGLLKSAGLSDKFIMNTEFALLCDTCDSDDIFENTKASYLVQAYARAIAGGLEANIWFDVTGTWGRNNGLLDRNLDPLDSFESYNYASHILSGITRARDITGYQGITGYEFWGAACENDTACNVWILWSIDGSDHEVSLPAIPLAVQDIYGNPNIINQILTVSLTPLYIDMPTSIPRLHLPSLYQCIPSSFGLIKNGDFKCEWNPWIIYDDDLQATLVKTSPNNPTNGTIDTAIPNERSSALLGNPDLPLIDNDICKYYTLPEYPNLYAGIDQKVTLPNSDSITLSFYYIIYSQDLSIRQNFDRFEVYIDDHILWGDGNEKNELGCVWYRVPGPDNIRPLDPTGQWAKATIDISSYAGQTINLSFRNYLRYDQWFNTYTYLDNVLITAE